MDANERRSRAAEEAAAWWVRLQEENLTRTEREEFVDWLRESVVHVSEMLRIAQVHGGLERFKRWTAIATGGANEGAAVVPLRAMPKESEAVTVSEGRKAVRITAWAAAVAAVAIAIAMVVPLLRDQAIETQRGERREVALEDGSVVQVDPETRLRIQFDEQTRRVVLDRGRALFRVASNTNRPFLVVADDTVVRAVGTAFAVDRQGEAIVVTVAEGKVSVSSTNGSGGERLEAGEERALLQASLAPVLLAANEQITVELSGVPEPIRAVDSSRELAWAQGRLVFENDAVTDVVEEFNRYNRIQLRVTDEALSRRSVSGVFDASDPESFIAFIQAVERVRVVRDNPEEITLMEGTGDE